MGLRNKNYNQTFSIIILILFCESFQALKNQQHNQFNIIEQIEVNEIDTKKRIGILSLPVKHHFGEVIGNKVEENNRNDEQTQIEDILDFSKSSSYYADSYIKWLQNSNDEKLEIIPLEYYSINNDNLPEIMSNLDGILLTGGGTAIFEKLISQNQHSDLGLISKTAQRIVTDYTNKVKDIIVEAEKINREGRQFPIWATCLGFESMLVHYTVSDFNFVIRKNFRNNAPIQIQNLEQIDDHMFKIFDQSERELLEKQDMHFFNHSQATLMKNIQNDEIFNQNMIITATSKLRQSGEEILAAYQSKQYPFYAVQYHPEKSGFEKFSGAIQDEIHISLMQKYSNYFLNKVNPRQYQTEYNILQQFQKNQMHFNNIGHFEQITLFLPNRLLK